MTFSLRTFLIVIGILAVWLAALFAKSPLLLEIVGYATALFVLMSLAFAIWDQRPRHRAFWTGFFVVGVGNSLAGECFNLEVGLRTELSDAILTPRDGSKWAPVTAPTNPFAAPVPVYPGPGFPSLPSGSGPSPTVPSMYYKGEQRHAIYEALLLFFSLLAAMLGGAGTYWIERRSEAAQ
jgi:hypothetical protein